MSKLRTIVWGTGNVGRPALRAVISHQQLELAGVVVASPDKEGQDAGELVGLPATGIKATRDWQTLLQQDIDAVVYTATGDGRTEEAIGEILACLQAGCNVVTSSIYPLLYRGTTPEQLLPFVDQICNESGASILVSGIDPGWVMDMLPVILSGTVSNIREIRCQEIFNYALYDQPDVVRNIIGFGLPMTETPPMLEDIALHTVWEPMVRLVADGVGNPVDEIRTEVQRLPLEQSLDIEGMGHFEAGTQGALRFEVQGICQGEKRFVVEHITRIHASCAPDWPYSPEGEGCHRVLIDADPSLEVSVHGHDRFEPGPAGGGNATAACRLVNAIPALGDARPGIVTANDLPLIHGGAQLSWASE